MFAIKGRLVFKVMQAWASDVPGKTYVLIPTIITFIAGAVMIANFLANHFLPAYVWIATFLVIGSVILFSIAPYWKLKTRLLKEKPSVSDPIIVAEREKHYQALHKIVQDLKDNLVLETNDFFNSYDIRFQRDFTAEAWQLNTPHQMGINWFIDQSGNLAVWFPVEDDTLFPCLREHLDGDEIWVLFSDLKKEITERIKRAASMQKGQRMRYSSEIDSLTCRIADKLSIILARGNYFSGRCQSCPDYQSSEETK